MGQTGRQIALRPLRPGFPTLPRAYLHTDGAGCSGLRESNQPTPAERSRIEELVAWEARIQAVGEWPLDAPALRRFLLYSLIPLGSWAGGALVERFVDSLLG